MQLRTRQFDIITTFLYSDLDEEIYIRIPEDYVRFMLELHNFPSKADTCLFIKKANGDEPMSFVIIYVDDWGIIGIIEALS
jgi:hypothetical protein